MANKRKRYSEDFKARIALEALKERQTISEIAYEHELHPNQVTQWKKQLLDNAHLSFSDGRKKSKQVDNKEALLYQQIGQLQVELDWLKKKSKEF
tara:strand:+ start:66 stop:350 length:285 start_codon:yes stop_codon:yes gene_type:complete